MRDTPAVMHSKFRHGAALMLSRARYRGENLLDLSHVLIRQLHALALLGVAFGFGKTTDGDKSRDFVALQLVNGSPFQFTTPPHKQAS